MFLKLVINTVKLLLLIAFDIVLFYTPSVLTLWTMWIKSYPVWLIEMVSMNPLNVITFSNHLPCHNRPQMYALSNSIACALLTEVMRITGERATVC